MKTRARYLARNYMCNFSMFYEIKIDKKKSLGCVMLQSWAFGVCGSLVKGERLLSAQNDYIRTS